MRRTTPATPSPPPADRPRLGCVSSPVDVPIRDESIRLGQLLKLAGVVDDGAVEVRRGAQVRPGQVVTYAGESLHVVAGG